MACALPYRAYFLQLNGDPSQAQLVLAEGWTHVLAAEPPWVEAELMMVRGQITRAAGDPLLAAEQLVQAADVAEACGHDWAYCSSGWIGAKVAMDLGDADRAVRQAARLVVHLDRVQDVTSWLACAHVLAGALGMGRPGVDGALLLGTVSAIGSRGEVGRLRNQVRVRSRRCSGTRLGPAVVSIQDGRHDRALAWNQQFA